MTTSIDRAKLVKLCAQVRPALATADYIPALIHIQFSDGFATAYNDVNAISVKADVGFDACVPGELLIKVLSSFKGEQVALTLGEKLLLTSGRSKINIPVLPANKFPFEPPTETCPELKLDEAMIEAIDRCLISVGTNPKQPARMGVTLEASGTGTASFYSTDGVTICRATTKSPVELPGDTPIILPTFLCEQIVSLQRTYPGHKVIMELLPGALIAGWGNDAMVYSKTAIDVEPLDFEKVLRKHFNPDKLSAISIPDSMDSAVGRALLVQSGSAYLRTKVESTGKGLRLSSSGIGDADDELDYAGPDFNSFHLDPALLARGLKVCSHIALEKHITVLTNEDRSFMYALAHHAEPR